MLAGLITEIVLLVYPNNIEERLSSPSIKLLIELLKKGWINRCWAAGRGPNTKEKMAKLSESLQATDLTPLKDRTLSMHSKTPFFILFVRTFAPEELS